MNEFIVQSLRWMVEHINGWINKCPTTRRSQIVLKNLGDLGLTVVATRVEYGTMVEWPTPKQIQPTPTC